MAESRIYHTVTEHTEGDYREKGSKFFGHLHPVADRDSIDQIIKEYRKANPKACHVCSAFVLNAGIEKVEKANDDGEPSGSAGMPILNALRSANVENVMIAVVRYYGGTNLGVSGLINAYRTAAELAIANANVIEVVPQTKYQLDFDYEIMGVLMEVLKDLDISIDHKDFGAAPFLAISIADSKADDQIWQLKRRLLRLPNNYEGEIKLVPGMKLIELNH